MNKINVGLLLAGFICLFVVAGWTGTVEARNSKPLVESFTGEHTGQFDGPVPTVAIIFQPGDCSGLIEALRVWNTPGEEEELKVIGHIHNTAGREEVIGKIVRGSGLSFPVVPLGDEPLRRLVRVLGYRTGSLILIFDPEGQLRMAVPLTALSTSQARTNVLDFTRALKTPSNH